jgi:hypothetical protein
MLELTASDPGALTFVGRGELTVDEILAAYELFLDMATPTAGVLWDLSLATLAAIPMAEFRALAERMAKMGAACRGGKAAVVCSRDVDFGIARMLQGLIADSGHRAQVAVFRELAEARVWLGRAAAGEARRTKPVER